MKLWLTFNEINAATMVLGALVETSTIRCFEGPISELPDNKQERYQALHHQFVASAMAVKYAHEHYPQFKLGNMICFMTSYPYTCDPADLLANQQAMNMSNWFCSDIQVRGVYPCYAQRFLTRTALSSKRSRGTRPF